MKTLIAAVQKPGLHLPQVDALKFKRRRSPRRHVEVKVQFGCVGDGRQEVWDVEETVFLVTQLVGDAATTRDRPVHLQMVPSRGLHHTENNKKLRNYKF